MPLGDLRYRTLITASAAHQYRTVDDRKTCLVSLFKTNDLLVVNIYKHV